MLPVSLDANVLTSFAFAFATVDATFDYQARIYVWDTGLLKATGPALYTSAPVNGTSAPTFSGLTLALTPGATYIAFLTTQNVSSNTFSNATLKMNTADVYAGGSAYAQSSLQPGNVDFTVQPWGLVNQRENDLNFRATFEPVVTPEPAAAGLTLAGLIGLVYGAQQRRKQATNRASRTD